MGLTDTGPIEHDRPSDLIGPVVDAPPPYSGISPQEGDRAVVEHVENTIVGANSTDGGLLLPRDEAATITQHDDGKFTAKQSDDAKVDATSTENALPLPRRDISTATRRESDEAAVEQLETTRVDVTNAGNVLPLPSRSVATPLRAPHAFPPPPKRAVDVLQNSDDPSHPLHYARDPRRLVAYLIPFPTPRTKAIESDAIPPRFLIYTPPPPPLKAPVEGVVGTESKSHKNQRKWQDEVKNAKSSDAKTASWHGLKAKATRGISTAMSMTKSSNLEFVNRISSGGDDTSKNQDFSAEPTQTPKLESMTLFYPSNMSVTDDQLRQEFIQSMMRTKTKAQRDAIIATGLLPVSAAIDMLATVVWPFGGLLEIDAVFLYSSAKGAKVSRSITKRLNSSSENVEEQSEDDKLRLEFLPSARLDVLARYLAAKCHDQDIHMFASPGMQPTETDVLRAIGWAPSQQDQATRNRDDEQWETSEVKDDIKAVMVKGAKEWHKWVKLYEKNPQKAFKS